MKYKTKKSTPHLKSFLKEVGKEVNPVIDQILLTGIDKKFHEIVKYQISSGGKRLRPALAILSCRMLKGKTKDVLYPAALLEILHNYTLITDDIIDHSDIRRNQPTVWKKFGKSMAECTAMIYAASIFHLPPHVKNKEQILRILTTTLKAITNGQFLDILFEQAGREDENYVVKNRYKEIKLESYFAMISRKTASLLAACLEIGGLCANADQRDIKKLRYIGHNLGIAFQIQDDLLDIFGNEKEFGKKIGKDIIEKKLGNIIISLALKEFAPPEKKRFLAIMKRKKVSSKDIKNAIALIKKTNAHSKAFKIKTDYINKAKKSLSSLPQNKWSHLLNELLDFSVIRKG